MNVDVYELRRGNLARALLVEFGEGRGKNRMAADKLGITPAELSQYLNKHKKIGANKARELERRLGLPPNTLDSHGLSEETLQIARSIDALSKDDKALVHDFIKRLRK